jgi:putative transcriptional regulator
MQNINFSKSVASHSNNGYYRGHFLIATPTMSGELFSRGVIYIFAHNAGGAMGILLNKPLDTIHYASLFQQLGIEMGSQNQDMAVYHGGPVEENRGFVVHSTDYSAEDTITHDCGIAVTASMNILRDLARGKGPARAVLSVGYAGWAAGQLEAEIEANYWVTAPASPLVAFHPDDDAKYTLAAKTLGIDMMRFSPVAGHA